MPGEPVNGFYDEELQIIGDEPSENDTDITEEDENSEQSSKNISDSEKVTT